MRLSQAGEPAPRQEGNDQAIRGAMLHGQVFLGLVDLPIIDLRHYLEDELDMHHVIASFAVRQRIQRAGLSTKQQLIWVAHKNHDAIPRALEVLDRWVKNLKANPGATVIEARPSDAMDTCFDENGSVIASGDEVWDGPWNQTHPGACSRVYPSYSTSRMVAGEDVAGDLFKCVLQPIEKAIANGVYAAVDMARHMDELKAIFPKGVCDYSKKDPTLQLWQQNYVGRP